MTEETTKYKNAYGYVRWSSDPQEDGNSDARQSDLMNAAAKRLGLPPLLPQRIFKDRGVSAAKGLNLKREWAKLKRELKKGDVIFVENTDRITRLDIDFLLAELREVCFDKGAFVIWTGSGIETNGHTYNKDLNLLVSATVSKSGSDRRRDLVRSAKRQWAADLKSGKWSRTGKLPFWLANGDNCFVLRDEGAAVVRRMFDLYNRGHSLGAIVKTLNNEKIHAPNKNNHRGWASCSVRQTLRHKACIGLLNQIDHSKKDVPKVYLYPPVVSESVFKLANDKLNRNPNWRKKKADETETDKEKLKEKPNWNRGRTSGMVNIFKGLLECFQCHNGMYYACAHHKHNRNFYYGCFGEHHRSCGSTSIRADYFDKSFRYLLSKSNIIVSCLKDGELVTPYKLDALKAKLAEVKVKEIKLTNIITNDPSPSENLLKSLKELEAENRRLTKDIDEEDAYISSRVPTVDMLKEYNVNRLNEKWDDPDSRLMIRETIRGIVDKIVINKPNKSYVIHFINGEEPIEVKLMPVKRRGGNGKFADGDDGNNGCEINGMKISYD